MHSAPRLIQFIAVAVVFLCGYAKADTPIKVFILAGQSNMEGKGRVETGNGGVAGAIGSLRYQVNNDPANYGHLVDGGGAWVTRSDVWVWSTTNSGEKGNLTVGFGTDAYIGPELGFGNVMGNVYDEPVLLIKAAWGGKSLAVDFRPPSSGGTVGPSYNDILSTVSNVLANLGTEFPGYHGQGYQIVGFGWHQGWNDRVNSAYVAEYEQNMANFIRDIRDDLHAPGLPFVIATTGMGGWAETNTRALALMDAQLAMADPAKYPEFEGNVAVVDTRDFWRTKDVSPIDQNYHWNGNGETYYLIGDSMGDAMKTLPYEPPPYYPLGDLNLDGAVSGLDWMIFIAANHADLSGLTEQQAYLLGDLDGDLDNDIYDFALFREAYEAAHPAPGAFEAMVASVSEPTSMLLLAAGAAAFGMRRKKRARQVHTSPWDRSDRSTVPPLANPGGDVHSTIFYRRNS